MKPTVLALIGSALVTVGSASESTISKNTADRLKEEFRYSPPPKESPIKPGDEVVLMEVFTVVESAERRDLERVIEEQERRAKDARYTIIKGGTLWAGGIGRTRIELGTWSGGGGLGFLRISW